MIFRGANSMASAPRQSSGRASICDNVQAAAQAIDFTAVVIWRGDSALMQVGALYEYPVHVRLLVGGNITGGRLRDERSESFTDTLARANTPPEVRLNMPCPRRTGMERTCFLSASDTRGPNGLGTNRSFLAWHVRPLILKALAWNH